MTVVPTAAALEFVGSATWAALSGKPVPSDVWTGVHEVPHVRIGQGADLVVVAPATADLLAKAAHGLADDLLTNTLLTARCPVVFAPAMHTEMWEHPATQANVAVLRARGAHVIDPAVGRLTGQDTGAGRLPEPEQLYAACLAILEGAASAAGQERGLEGRRVVVTAGGTREPLDPVRFLGNRSSGKQGVAIAEAARARGAEVTLIAANLEIGEPAGCDIRRVSTALELQQAVTDAAQGADVVVMAAAVADYRPADVSESKLKKDPGDAGMTLELVRNPDILAGLGHAPHDGTLLVGFAAETEPDDDRLLELGRAKREAKGADLLVVNRVGWNEGFASDENAVVVIGRDGGIVTRAHGTKMSVADDILDVVVSEATTAAVAADTSKEHEPTT